MSEVLGFDAILLEIRKCGKNRLINVSDFWVYFNDEGVVFNMIRYEYNVSFLLSSQFVLTKGHLQWGTGAHGRAAGAAPTSPFLDLECNV